MCLHYSEESAKFRDQVQLILSGSGGQNTGKETWLPGLFVLDDRVLRTAGQISIFMSGPAIVCLYVQSPRSITPYLGDRLPKHSGCLWLDSILSPLLFFYLGK